MSRLSTIPITLDPSIYRPQAPARSGTDIMERRQSRSITLAPSVYEPRKRSATDERPKRSKNLPPIPRSPWPAVRAQAERNEDILRMSRRQISRGARDQFESGRTHSEPPSRQGSFYTDVEAPERRAHSNPPSRKGTMNAVPPRRPTVVQETLRSQPPIVSAPKPVSTPPFTSESKIPSSPPSRSSTLVEEPLPSYSPQSRSNSFQTRYMNMLLSLDKIPRLHNILAAFFGWIMLAGFIVFPGTFTSLAKLQDSAAVQQTPGASDVLDTVQSLPLLVVAAVCCGIGYAGNLWLSVRWRLNYVWLINRLYMPGTLNALAGLVSTLTSIYSQHKGSWSVSAKVAVVVESVTLVFYLVLFLLYNSWLLEKVKQQHDQEFRGGLKSKTFKVKVGEMATQPAVAPGSIV